MQWFTAPDYWFAREVFQRGLAIVYLVAFAGAARQFRALIGASGMLPVPRFLARTSVRRAPSIFHLHYSDRFFAGVAWFGAALAVALAAGADDRVPLWAAMLLWLLAWVLYLSIVNVGQVWYAFGWESLLLETGFLAVFLGNDRTAPPILVLWLARWLLFRVEFGAGLVKMRGDPCWRDLTCLYYHHETQPMPGPASRMFHRLPRPLHRVEVAANHVVQLVVPFALFTPQPVASIAAAVVVATQLWLILSGNFAWLNWLTILLACTAIDARAAGAVVPLPAPPALPGPPPWFLAAVLAFTVAVVVLSYWPVRNLLSSHQRMNASFNHYHLVNTYGAFGRIERRRFELVVEGTSDPVLTERTHWREYEFKGKPGDPRRMPRQWAPWHLRLDWLMWFAAISPTYARAWLGPFLQRLLTNDPATVRLLRHNPFPDSPPTYIRVRHFRYRFSTKEEFRHDHVWWHRTPVGDYVPPIALDSLR
ncbi:lipase maturation factor family protein [Nocardia spumae]|uniref:lipase maturation factor family protein n=1 Tax=Nocardia spumae TaxID=2887190 RepID=UPI001D138D4D|nr:lipase maturation factor family protein [Nocardia spumae]